MVDIAVQKEQKAEQIICAGIWKLMNLKIIFLV